jgi:hypothetical protein
MEVTSKEGFIIVKSGSATPFFKTPMRVIPTVLDNYQTQTKPRTSLQTVSSLINEFIHLFSQQSFTSPLFWQPLTKGS